MALPSVESKIRANFKLTPNPDRNDKEERRARAGLVNVSVSRASRSGSERAQTRIQSVAGASIDFSTLHSLS